MQAALDLFDHRLEAVLELALDPGAGLQQAQVEGVQGHILEHRRHVTLGDAQGQAFDHGGFADPGLAREDRVVLAATGEDVDHLPYFELAAQHRVDAAFAGALGQVDRVLVQRRGLAAGLARTVHWRCGAGQRAGLPGLRAAFYQRGKVQAQVIGVDFLQLRRRGDYHATQFGIVEQGLQQVSAAHLADAVFDRRQQPGLLDHAGDVRRQRRGAGIAFLEGAQGGDQLRLQALGDYLVVAQDRRQVAVAVVEQLQQQVLHLHVVMVLRQAQGRRAFGGRAAGFVELGEQRLQVHKATPS
ncbi:hypothetical protein D3C79_628300 [compost metagenome]